jgi:hypothetical protein
MSSEFEDENTLNEFFKEGLFAFGDDGLLSGDFFDKFVNLGPGMTKIYTRVIG